MAIFIETPRNLGLLDKVLLNRSKIKAEERAVLEQERIDALRIRAAALERLPLENTNNLPFLKIPYVFDTSNLGGITTVIVDSKKPKEKDIKIRFPARRLSDRYESLGTGTLNIDPVGNIQTKYIEFERRPLPYKTMKSNDFILGKEAIPALLTHSNLLLIGKSVSEAEAIKLSDSIIAYQNAIAAEQALQEHFQDVNPNIMIILSPSQEDESAA